MTIINKSFNKEDFESRVMIKSRNDHMEPFREEYNQMLKRRISGGKNEIKREICHGQY